MDEGVPQGATGREDLLCGASFSNGMGPMTPRNVKPPGGNERATSTGERGAALENNETSARRPMPEMRTLAKGQHDVITPTPGAHLESNDHSQADPKGVTCGKCTGRTAPRAANTPTHSVSDVPPDPKVTNVCGIEPCPSLMCSGYPLAINKAEKRPKSTVRLAMTDPTTDVKA